MRVVHLSKSDFRGAGSRGVLALHRQLLECGITSRFFSLERLSPASEPVIPTEVIPIADFVQKAFFEQNPAHALSSSFTLGFPSGGRTDDAVLREADIIHLHDIKGFLSPHALHRLIALGKPIVWSLSDMWAFTGGCHHALDCRGYRQDCTNCVQLGKDQCGLPSLLLEQKRALFAGPPLHLLCTTQWLAERARESRVFPNASVHAVPPLADDAICPQPRPIAKVQLGIDPEAFTLLFICETTGREPRHRKAFQDFLEACSLYNTFKNFARKKKLRILVLGCAPEDFQNVSGAIPVEFAGDDQKLSLFLSAADLVVLPHFEENGARIVLDAACCGTPVLAMHTGGMDEVIQDGVTGRLMSALEPRRMAEEISYLALHPKVLSAWGENCLSAFENSPNDALAQHLALYERLAATPAQPLPPEPGEIVPRDLREEIAALTPVFLDALNFSLETVTQAARAKEESAFGKFEQLKTEIQTAIDKLSLAEQRIAAALGGKSANPKLAKAVESARKVRHRLARVLRECKSENQKSQRARIFHVPKPRLCTLAPAPNAGERILEWLYNAHLEKNYIQEPGKLAQYAPRPLALEKFPRPRMAARKLPTIAIVTPSYMQGPFIEQTIRSVVEQGYPKLRYAVQDAASTDETVEVLKKLSPQITSWVSEPDTGQARAVVSGFEKISGDIMAWLNSDDLLMPGALHFIGEYFRKHPDVDALYGHRVIINEHGREVARWVLPKYEQNLLRSIDFVPQETLFWRKSLWEKVGGINPQFRFALDWDLLLRFQNAGAKIVRVPYFLGCFRVHTLQKTSAQMESVGSDEINHLRAITADALTDPMEIEKLTRKMIHQSAFCDWLLRLGIRW